MGLQHCPLVPTGKGHDLGVSVVRGVLTMRVVLCDLSVFRGIRTTGKAFPAGAVVEPLLPQAG